MSSTSSRRSFLQQAAASVGLVLSATAVAGLVAGCEKDETTPVSPCASYDVSLAPFPELGTVGGIIQTTVPGVNNGELVFISRIDTSTFVVFSTICTHSGCGVDLPVDAAGNCVCPCHKAEFARTNGAVLKQPTTGSATDLPRFSCAYNASSNVLTITV
jgi:Rieske Fe-S protein